VRWVFLFIPEAFVFEFLHHSLYALHFFFNVPSHPFLGKVALVRSLSPPSGLTSLTRITLQHVFVCKDLCSTPTLQHVFVCKGLCFLGFTSPTRITLQHVFVCKDLCSTPTLQHVFVCKGLCFLGLTSSTRITLHHVAVCKDLCSTPTFQHVFVCKGLCFLGFRISTPRAYGKQEIYFLCHSTQPNETFRINTQNNYKNNCRF
jgi:hypothetical protein